MSIRFNRAAFLLTIILFGTEVVIAAYLHDNIIRPHGGDFLVVILLYCFVQSFFRIPVNMACLAVLIFAYTVEVSQYFHLATLLGLQHSRPTIIVLGTTFSWMDMFCYTAGILLVWVVEKTRQCNRLSINNTTIIVK